MPALVDMVNDSLSQIGEGPINDLAELTTKAAICNRHLEITLRSMLGACKWNFAYTRQSIAADAAAPVNGFLRMFTLPPYVRVWGINDDGMAEGRPDPCAIYKIERDQADGNVKLFTNEVSPIILHYSAYVTDPNKWDGMFGFAFTVLLASKFAGSIAHDAGLARSLKQDFYSLHLPSAMASDGIEGQGGEVVISDDLLMVRDG